MRVNEIFYSLQGEGMHTGRAAVFLRLSGCNLHCSFCDTAHQEYTEMTEEEILHAILRYPTRHIVITGGEPTLQLTGHLIDLLHQAKYYIQIETNGTTPLPAGEDVDWITCSPKEGGPVRIQRIDELKVVYQGQDMSQYDQLHAQCYSLQPLDCGDKERNKDILKKTIDYIQQHPIWKLSLQTHKILRMR